MLSPDDLYLFNEGTHCRLYEHLGAHRRGGGAGGGRGDDGPGGRAGGGPGHRKGTGSGSGDDGRSGDDGGTEFAVWAPNADEVAVVGDFNGWAPRPGDHLAPQGSSGIWAGAVADAGQGALYKFRIRSRQSGEVLEKADPFAFRTEVPPRTASVVWDLDYPWGDREWMDSRVRRNALDAPLAVYEVHLGSWRRVPEEGNRSLTYAELGPALADHAAAMGFTHVELLPVMEHPFYGSWGYQCTGYFAPTARFGSPQELMSLVDCLHQRGIGVILDWVPSHFATDEHGLVRFDGTHLYEHADPRQGIHPDWGSCIFNYGRHEVSSFLLSSAHFWLDRYHADGLRLDAVASMLYLDYSRQQGQWIPNAFGGRENLEAIAFLRRLNELVYGRFPDVQTVAEESTSWPMVTRPTYVGGLGFGLKWDMGWMHDTLEYMRRDPVHRRHHQDQLTFRSLYAGAENFILPLSHDEVVHGKGSLLGKMPGDHWQRLANLRLLLAWMYAQPGKKLLFMGGELGQPSEWSHESSVDWHVAGDPGHAGVTRWVQDLNRLLRQEPALHELDCEPGGFAWVDCADAQQSVVSLLRQDRGGRAVLAALNFTPVPRHGYRIGVPEGGRWRELLNSDAPAYGGSGQGNLGGVEAQAVPAHGLPWSLELTLPPLGALFLRP